MRHISKDQNNLIARAQLESDSYCNDVRSSVRKRKGTYHSYKYGHDIVRNELRYIYHDKCCYCEAKIQPISTPHIEHYRPKAKITGVNDSGYYWLGYEWSNLLLACPACNGIKANKFPLLRNNHITDHPLDNQGVVDFSQFPILSSYLNEERPLLINPELVKPENLLHFNYFCHLVAKKDNILGKTTIKEIQLNRDDLVADRQEKVDEIIRRIEEQIVAKHRFNYSIEVFQYQLNLIFKDIITRCHPAAEYSLLGINMVERFEELILEDIESEFRDNILDLFIDYLQDL